MQVSPRLNFVTTTLLVIVLASVAAAQRNPPMPSQLNDAEKEQLYARFSENKKVAISERQRLAYEAAREYVKRFGTDQDPHVPEVRRFVTEYERVMRIYELHSAYVARKYAKTFEVGRLILQTDPENFYALATLTQAGYDSAQTGDSSLNEETVGYARKAVAAAGADKLSNPDPFASLEAARGFLNLALGWFLRTQSPVEAAAALVRAAQSDSQYNEDPLTYNLLGIAILKGEYAQVSAEYNAKFGNKPPSPEQEAMWDRIIKLGERAIDAYARAVALSTKPEQQEGRSKMLTQLTALYKNFHNGSDDGLKDLIATVLTKPLP